MDDIGLEMASGDRVAESAGTGSCPCFVEGWPFAEVGLID